VALYRDLLATELQELDAGHFYKLQTLRTLGLALQRQGRFDEAVETMAQMVEGWRRRVEATPRDPSARASLANAHNEIALVYQKMKRWDEMHDHWEAVAEIGEALVRDVPEETAYKKFLRFNCWNLGVSHMKRGELEQAFQYRQRGVELSRQILETAPDNEDYRKSLDDDITRLVTVAANLSWRLSTAADPANRDSERAVEVATVATELRPDVANHWSNLGVAQYRAGNWQAAVEALEKVDVMIEGGDRIHRMFFAMAHWQLGDKERARRLYAQGAAWIAEHRKNSEEHNRLRTEAEGLMGITEQDRNRLVEEYLARPADETAKPPNAKPAK
jgi:tetratricopeptide (TPR) repeat protein